MAYAFDPRAEDVEGGGSRWVLGWTGLYSKLQDNRKYRDMMSQIKIKIMLANNSCGILSKKKYLLWKL